MTGIIRQVKVAHLNQLLNKRSQVDIYSGACFVPGATLAQNQSPTKMRLLWALGNNTEKWI